MRYTLQIELKKLNYYAPGFIVSDCDGWSTESSYGCDCA
ncbi:hypothetical protein A464_1774 [Salmonella bongori N268-08]|uniref:Uncharacterized protein n=1 Tax=Salmonella bongori N268-08 TaxID=1197719 RepID=S5MWI6_SALBN|nr:hypothetical protein A464_1774 [Salmonella bongori N268-08]